MKTNKVIAIAAVIVVVIVSVTLFHTAICSQTTEDTNRKMTQVNGGMDSLKKTTEENFLRDYQIAIDTNNDSIYLWDKARFVGGFAFSHDKDPLSTIIHEDNK